MSTIEECCISRHAGDAPVAAEMLPIVHLASTGRLAIACAIHLHGLLDVAIATAARVSRAAGQGAAWPAIDELREVLSRAGDVTRQLLTSAHRPAADTALVDLGALVDQMRPIIALIAGPEAFVVVVRDAVDVIACSNRGAIEQILVNLIVGPAEAEQSGRRVTISSGFTAWPGGAVSEGASLAAGTYAMLSVSDERRAAHPGAPLSASCPSCGVVPEIGLPLVAAIARAWGGALVTERSHGGALEHRVLLPAGTP